MALSANPLQPFAAFCRPPGAVGWPDAMWNAYERRWPRLVELGIRRSVEKGIKGIAQQIFTDPFVDNDFYR